MQKTLALHCAACVIKRKLDQCSHRGACDCDVLSGDRIEYMRMATNMTTVVTDRGRVETVVGQAVIDWIFSRPGFALEELQAHVPKEDPAECRCLVDDMVRIGLLTPTSL